MLCSISICDRFLKWYLVITRINVTVNYDVLWSWSMQLYELIIIVVAAPVFERETNTGHTAKCDWIVIFQNVVFLLGRLKKKIIIIK